MGKRKWKCLDGKGRKVPKGLHKRGDVQDWRDPCSDDVEFCDGWCNKCICYNDFNPNRNTDVQNYIAHRKAEKEKTVLSDKAIRALEFCGFKENPRAHLVPGYELKGWEDARLLEIGEELEFSDGKKCWIVDTFDGFVISSDSPWLDITSRWKHARIPINSNKE